MPDDYVGNDTDQEHINEGESLEPALEEDNAAPLSAPSDPTDDASADVDHRVRPELDETHQATDSATDLDSQQLYDEGLSGAAEAAEPNAGNAVVGYDPTKDQRKQNDQQ